MFIISENDLNPGIYNQVNQEILNYVIRNNKIFVSGTFSIYTNS